MSSNKAKKRDRKDTREATGLLIEPVVVYPEGTSFQFYDYRASLPQTTSKESGEGNLNNGGHIQEAKPSKILFKSKD